MAPVCTGCGASAVASAVGVALRIVVLVTELGLNGSYVLCLDDGSFTAVIDHSGKDDVYCASVTIVELLIGAWHMMTCMLCGDSTDSLLVPCV